ncbi:MAG TPA: response regulator [Candidatus Binatia bacterium]
MVWQLRLSRFTVQKQASVLIVDDDEALTIVLAEFLNARGYRVSTASNGARGYVSFLTTRPDFIVTDLQMPELNGIDMVRCIRAIDSAVKVIYMSAGPDRFAPDLKTEQRDFAASFLMKPFASGELLDLMRNGRKSVGETTAKRSKNQLPNQKEAL